MKLPIQFYLLFSSFCFAFIHITKAADYTNRILSSFKHHLTASNQIFESNLAMSFEFKSIVENIIRNGMNQFKSIKGDPFDKAFGMTAIDDIRHCESIESGLD